MGITCDISRIKREAQEFIKENIKEGKEYFIGYAHHAGIAKKVGDEYLFLELQNHKGKNRWYKLHIDDFEMLKKQTYDRFGYEPEKKDEKGIAIQIMEAEDVPKIYKFREMLGYINTR